MRTAWLSVLTLSFVAAIACGALQAADDADRSFPLKGKRILFLGDSITYAGEFINLMELQVRLQSTGPIPEFLNAGLPSETCTGLSEPEHPFPRPNVHERLERALSAVKPDVVVACYGMNDGIYYPFSEDRFEQYQQGINRLIDTVHATGAKLILLTPPPFDALPLKTAGKLLPEGSEKYAWFAIYENYDQVIQKYAEWVLQQKDRVEMTVDLYHPTIAFWKKQRESDPTFTVAPDGVHCNSTGHRTIAEIILKEWGIPNWRPVTDEMTKLANEKGAILRDSLVSRIGHKRPGMAAGLEPEAARVKAAEIDTRLTKLIEAASK